MWWHLTLRAVLLGVRERVTKTNLAWSKLTFLVFRLIVVAILVSLLTPVNILIVRLLWASVGRRCRLVVVPKCRLWALCLLAVCRSAVVLVLMRR